MVYTEKKQKSGFLHAEHGRASGHGLAVFCSVCVCFEGLSQGTAVPQARAGRVLGKSENFHFLASV